MTHEHSTRRIVLVGHCGPDVFMLKTAIARLLPDAEIAMANDSSSLNDHLDDDPVLLVNRELDGRFHTTSGVELIASLNDRASSPVSLLISNFEEAQTAAQAAGARPGFGKSHLYDDTTAQRLRDAATVSG